MSEVITKRSGTVYRSTSSRICRHRRVYDRRLRAGFSVATSKHSDSPRRRLRTFTLYESGCRPVGVGLPAWWRKSTPHAESYADWLPNAVVLYSTYCSSSSASVTSSFYHADHHVLWHPQPGLPADLLSSFIVAIITTSAATVQLHGGSGRSTRWVSACSATIFRVLPFPTLAKWAPCGWRCSARQRRVCAGVDASIPKRRAICRT